MNILRLTKSWSLYIITEKKRHIKFNSMENEHAPINTGNCHVNVQSCMMYRCGKD